MNTVARMPSAGVGRLAKSMSGPDSVMVAPIRHVLVVHPFERTPTTGGRSPAVMGVRQSLAVRGRLRSLFRVDARVDGIEDRQPRAVDRPCGVVHGIERVLFCPVSVPGRNLRVMLCVAL